uniref:Rhodopsin, GQ-coupled n=1 Tax=Cacopsylla melanoneura TaxID=428564 RepID=A0A8D8YVL2_9HEMI
MSAGTWLYLLLSFVTLLGLGLNVYILIVALLSKELATGNKLLLIHLSIVNVILSLLFLLVVVPHMFHYFSFLQPPLLIRHNSRSPPPSNQSALCEAHGFLFSLLNSVAIWNICGLNCDRYYAIAAPLHYSVLINQKKIFLCLAVIWLFCLLACIPPFFRIAPYSYDPDLASCVPDFTSGKLSTVWYSGFFIVSTFLLPATVIVICNIKVLMIARYHRHRIASAIFEVTLSAQVTITHQKNPFYNSFTLNKFLTRKSAYNTVFELLGSFILIYLPYYGMIVVYHVVTLMSNEHPTPNELVRENTNVHNRVFATMFTNEQQKSASAGFNDALSVLSFVSFTLLTSSTLINSLLYGIKSKILRKSFANYWRKQKSKCEIYNEIQARTPSTCGSRRPSLTPLGILTKPAPLIRRTSDIGIECNSNNTSNSISKSSSNSGTKKHQHFVNLSTRQMSTSTSKLSLSTQEKLTAGATMLTTSVANHHHRMSNSVQNIPSNKSFFHIKSHHNQHNSSSISHRSEATTSFINSPRIMITKTFSQDNGGQTTDDEFASLEPNRSLESGTTYESVRQSDSELAYDSASCLEISESERSSFCEKQSSKAFDSIQSYEKRPPSSSRNFKLKFFTNQSFDSDKGFDPITEFSLGPSAGTRDGKVLSFLSLNSDIEDEDDVTTLSKTCVSE